MNNIGKYRLKIYELLYNYPICKFAETNENGKQLNVLIIGNGWAGNEAFKATFWAGQYPGSELNITVASKNASEYQRFVMSDKSVMPALQHFVNKKKYANLRFIDVDFCSEQNLIDDALDFKAHRYNYIFVTLGDEELNWLVTSDLVHRLIELKDNISKNTGNVIINVFDEFSHLLNKKDQETLKKLGLSNDILINFFGNESTIQGGELERIAKNINFSYAQKYDQRVSRNESDELFESSKIAEFYDSPVDYECGDLSIVKNFIGSNYNADSSYASAVHIPCKLEVCREHCGNIDPIKKLQNAISSKNQLYKKMIALEHRRWNAYMITRGYRAPSAEEENKYLYREVHGKYNRHKDDNRLLHICLCECGEKGLTLEDDFFGQYKRWIEKKCPSASPSELDRASLRCHQITSELSKKVNPESIFELIPGSNIEYVNLRKSIIKLVNDEDNSVALYRKTFKTAFDYAKSFDIEKVEKLNLLNRQLDVITTRNQRMDFLSLDAQIVDMIPFVLWYRKSHKVIVTVTDGDPTQDIIIPTIFNAEQAIFLTSSNEEKYEKILNSFFEKRGNYTQVTICPTESMSADSVDSKLLPLIDEVGAENMIINCISGINTKIVVGIGRLAERYRNLTVVQYNEKNGVDIIYGNEYIAVGLNNKYISVGEFIELTGGKISNEYSPLYDSNRYDSLVDLFWKYSVPVVRKKGANETATHIIWNLMAEFFKGASKVDDSIDKTISSSETEEPLEYGGTFSNKVYVECGIRNVLDQLAEYCVIKNFKTQKRADKIDVSFICYNSELINIIRGFEIKELDSENKIVSTLTKKVRFSSNDGFKLSNRKVENAAFCTDSDNESIVESKKKMLLDMKRMGLITNLVINEGMVSFEYIDDETMELFKKQGAIFELIVYSYMRESGLFDDIISGTKILWNAEESQMHESILKAIEKSNSIKYGYKDFIKLRDRIRDSQAFKSVIDNEIDVIATSGMNTIFASCKTGKSNKREWIYEISSLSSKFKSQGVLAVSNEFCGGATLNYSNRAYQMDISLLGTETLCDKKQLEKALKKIAKGVTYRY